MKKAAYVAFSFGKGFASLIVYFLPFPRDCVKAEVATLRWVGEERAVEPADTKIYFFLDIQLAARLAQSGTRSSISFATSIGVLPLV